MRAIRKQASQSIIEANLGHSALLANGTKNK